MPDKTGFAAKATTRDQEGPTTPTSGYLSEETPTATSFTAAETRGQPGSVGGRVGTEEAARGHKAPLLHGDGDGLLPSRRDPEAVVLSAVCQTDTDRCDFTYVWSLQNEMNKQNRNKL